MSKKKTKRIISLILALTMIFTFMAMSASAATTEVQPRATCGHCGGSAFRYAYSRTESQKYLWKDNATCDYMSAYHAHYKVPSIMYTYCRTCNNCVSSMNYEAIYCVYGGYLT